MDCADKKKRGRPKKQLDGILLTSKIPKATKAFYFRVSSDICLLQLALQLNPFEDKNAWDTIILNMSHEGFQPSRRQCKERIERLLSLFEQQNLASINKTGTEEEWDKRAELLNQVQTMKEAASVIQLIDDDNSAECVIQAPFLHEARKERDEIANSLMIDAPTEFTRKNPLIKKKRRDSMDDVLLEKAKMDHEFAKAKLKGEIEAEIRKHELETKKVELEFQSRQQHTEVLDRIVKIQHEAATRDDSMKHEFLKMSQTMMLLVTKCIDNKQ